MGSDLVSPYLIAHEPLGCYNVIVLTIVLPRLASTIFHHFIAADSGHESLQALKRIHGLIPYFVLKGILKISNPVGMIRGTVGLYHTLEC